MANRKRSGDTQDSLKAKIRKLESRLKEHKNRRRIIISSSSEEDEREQVSTCSTAPPCTGGATPATGTAARGGRARPPTSQEGSAGRHASGSARGAPLAAEQRGTTDEISDEPRQPATAASTSATTSVTRPASDLPPEPETVDPALDEDLLLLLGDAPVPETEFGRPVHRDVASRWQDILAKGLPKDTLDKLLKEYLIPKNCDMLVSPILNPEVKVALSESMVKRDASLSAKQKQIGIALAALSQAVDLVVNKESCTQRILKPLSDAGRILCDSYFNHTRTRRGFVVAAINAELKEAVTQSKTDKFLFGTNIAEQLKSAKTIKQSGSILKQTIKNDKSQKFHINNFIKNKNNSNHLNWTAAAPRRAPNKQAFPRPAARRPTARASFQQREKSERSSPARRPRRR